jgi:hypothetical protein
MTTHMNAGFLSLVATVSLVAACGGDPVAAGPETPTTSSSAATPSSRAGWTPIPVDAEGLIPAGRQGMTANGRPDAPWVVVDVPDGFSSIGGWVIFDEDPQGGGGVSYWTVSEVVHHPCSAYGAANAIDAGRTVEELVAKFRRQHLTHLTAPVPVTVDGYQGLSLELHVPKGIDFTACPDYNLWESDPAGARHMSSPGEFDRLWILDVDGEVVVLTVTADADDPKSSLDELADMVESAEFVARD